MTPEACNIQFSRQIWQAVSENAHQCLSRENFCVEQSRIENLRCVYFVDEDEVEYGKQIWCFEAVGVDAIGRRQILYGVLEFSIQYALLEATESAIFDDDATRQSFIVRQLSSIPKDPYSYASTKFWVTLACSATVILALVWTLTLINYLNSGA